MFAHRKASPLQDVSRGQGRILAMLKIKDKMTAKDLSYLLGIRQQSLNESLKKLEKAGYITRQPSLEDGRVMEISLTEKGRDLKQISNNNSDVLDGFLDEELKQFGSYVDRLWNAYDEKVEADPEDQEMYERMRERMDMMRDRMGDDDFDEMMRRCRHMGMPFGMMHHMHGRHHGYNNDDFGGCY
ncbi:MarR family transcriptional regulator [Lactobacillus kefiranofaciens subsp. kefiranofaciens DSM 5016 = JCM 6985]|nr:MarR family transcriptional regulator [Lactobacillus kefiranofaciens subsp. kefirgranum DSM 10550 = JCM 8572]KRM21678.1 MarR family transcriptional regulator [Lactobacillus kefiranofaciens subsp. kefiranofaciens DSM 5016 = JCM 6985]